MKIVILFGLLNVLLSHVWQISLFSWLRFYEALFLAFVVYNNKRDILSWIQTPLSLSLIYVSLIAFGQFFFQKTIGGPLYWLGERSFDGGTPGIALASYFGKILMRPYSTFPHPNALAGYLALSVIFLLLIKKMTNLTKIAIFLSLATILISFSKNVWVSSATIFVIYLFKDKLNFKLIKYSSFIFIFLITAFLSFGNIQTSSEEIYKRFELAHASVKIWQSSPLVGVGANNFITYLPIIQQKYPTIITRQVSWWLQPVHSIYLLILSEEGIFGIVLFLILIIKLLKHSLKPAIFLILLTGLLDHYWLTIHQNFFLMAIILGVAI